MNTTRSPIRSAALHLCGFGLTVLAACSSVDSVNDQAMLVGREERSATTPELPLPWARPEPGEYRIGARDLLEVDVYELEEPDKSKQIKTRVSQDGTILLPLIGRVHAVGSTVHELQTAITERLAKDFLVNPSVSVVIAEHMARRVTVLGAVVHPGTFFLKDNSTTLLDALALAGGPDDKAGTVVRVVRDQGLVKGTAVADASTGAVTTAEMSPRVLKIDLTDLMEGGRLDANCTLEDGDLVHVPTVPQFFVMGQVHEGGAFPLRGEVTLLRGIALAGGLTDTASPAATVLIRTTPKGRVTTPIDLTEVQAGSEKDILLQPDDVLVVNESTGDAILRGTGVFLRGLFHFTYPLR